MHFVVKALISHSTVHTKIRRGLLAAILLASVFLSACNAAANSAVTPQATNTPDRDATRAARPTHGPTSTDVDLTAPFLTGATPTQLPPNETAVPVTTDTPLPLSTATQGTVFPTPFVAPTTSWFIYNMAADIQNNANGVLNVLGISGDNGTANIIIRTAYWDKSVQNKAGFNVVKYLATYFTGLDEKGIAALFGGSHFSVYIKSLSPNDQYIVETTTPYALMVQVGQKQVSQAAWEATVKAQIQMQYIVKVLCTAKPTSVPANAETLLLVDGWLTHDGKYDPIRYLSASWTDSTGRQYYCTGGEFDSSCKGPTGSVNPGSTMTVNVAIEAADGLKYTCQASYSAP